MFSTLLSAVLAAVALASQAGAEYHTIRFYNACGFGTPMLLASGDVLSYGEDYTSDGAFSSGIAYLQNGDQCGYNGEDCTLMEMTITNPTCAGCGSSADISLISPHSFSYWTSFAYFDGCDNTGANCPASGCSAAFYYSDETQVQVACQAENVGLLIAFCADATTLDANNLPGTSASSSSEAPSSTSTYVAPTTSTYVAPTTTSTYVAPTSSASSSFSLSSSASSSSAAASASSSAKCPARNTKRALRLKRSAEPEPGPKPIVNVAMHHRAHRASH
ncbi:hypothetical protein DAEQUDRAFT_61027 [Daedalea quercina L-15889]|uniref:Glycopeptide n=1 Tax=Daedalea quercina L-15889 TaxID=1314783 RepID=A0A165SLN9_9APHY|nr:hypothetical protein DAEQUDRAFT_61027 [Daedalea quercina L-15889]